MLAGVGKYLRLYELGKKKLLRKCENKSIPQCITGIKTMGHRILVSDIRESVFYCRYKVSEAPLFLFFFFKQTKIRKLSNFFYTDAILARGESACGVL